MNNETCKKFNKNCKILTLLVLDAVFKKISGAELLASKWGGGGSLSAISSNS